MRILTQYMSKQLLRYKLMEILDSEYKYNSEWLLNQMNSLWKDSILQILKKKIFDKILRLSHLQTKPDKIIHSLPRGTRSRCCASLVSTFICSKASTIAISSGIKTYDSIIGKNLFSILLKNGYPVVPVVPLLLTQASFLKVTTLNSEKTKIT